MQNPRVWVWDELLPAGGYGDGYGYIFALMGMGIGWQNPWVLYLLTSLRRMPYAIRLVA
jgi:hypothetical protein